MPETILPDRHPDAIRPGEEERILQGIRKAISVFNEKKSKDYACDGCGLIQEAQPRHFSLFDDGRWIMDSPYVDTTGWSHVTIPASEGPGRIERYCPPCVAKRDAAVGRDPQKKEGDSA